MFDRIKFKLSFKKNFPFKYDPKTGVGISPQEYSMLTDRVRFRSSQYGYVNGFSLYGKWIERDQFLKLYNGE